MRRLVVVGPRGIRLRCLVPETRRERVRGLCGRYLDDGTGMLFERATSVHTFGMRQPILVARLDRALGIVSVKRLRPWRVLLPSRRGRHILECDVEVDLQVGDQMRLAQTSQARTTA